MDARNEFKVMFSLDGKDMRERKVSSISKVFSPSQFIHAQKKKSFYKALSGLSFHDSNSKDRKVSTKVEGAKYNPINMSKSEGYTPEHTSSHERDNSRLQSKNRDEKNSRRILSEKSLVNENNSRKSSHDSYFVSDESKPRESICSQRKHQLRPSNGGYDNMKRSFGRYELQDLPKNSNDRPKNRSHSVNHITASSEYKINDINTKQEYPVRPERTRSISQSRKNGTIIAPNIQAFQRDLENYKNQRSNKQAQKYEEKYLDHFSELKDIDKDVRSRSRRKSEITYEPEFRREESKLKSNISSSRNSISYNNSNSEIILNEDGKRRGRYKKNNQSSNSNSQLVSKNNLSGDMICRINLGSTENSNRIRSYARQNSEETNVNNSGERIGRFRSRSVITPNRDQILPLEKSNQYNNDQPLRPRRTRSTSRSKPSIVSNIFNIPNQFNIDIHQKDNLRKYENDSEQAKLNDSGLEDNETINPTRSKKKSESARSSNNKHRRSKYINDYTNQDYSQSEDDKDGGYYSLEKEESTADITKRPYQLPPPAKNTNPEYFQSDHSDEAIYISQVFMNIDKNNSSPQNKNTSIENSFCDDYQTISHILGEDIYDNCQRNSLERYVSTTNVDDNDNFQITQTVEETEIYEIPFDSQTLEDNEDLYETIEFSNYEQVNNADRKQYHPIIDESDEDDDYMDIKDFPAIKSESKVTVITINDSDVEVTETISPSSNMPIKSPTHGRHDGYFNPYAGSKLSQPNSSGIYDNLITPASHMDNSRYTNDSNSTSHSYPVTKAMIPRIPERNQFMSQSELLNTPSRQSRPYISNQNKHNINNENNNKTDINNQESNGFEFISETNYKVDNLDYTFKLNFSQLPKRSPHMEFFPKESSKSNFIPNDSSQSQFIRKSSFQSKTSKVSLSPHQVHTLGDLLQPLTFQDLLKDKHLNPPENEAVLDTQFCDTLRTDSLSYPESQAQKQLEALYQSTLNTKRILERELSNQSFSDNISICWSEADSEFEFMNVTK